MGLDEVPAIPPLIFEDDDAAIFFVAGFSFRLQTCGPNLGDIPLKVVGMQEEPDSTAALATDHGALLVIPGLRQKEPAAARTGPNDYPPFAALTRLVLH